MNYFLVFQNKSYKEEREDFSGRHKKITRDKHFITGQI